jgi:hypothetical protein
MKTYRSVSDADIWNALSSRNGPMIAGQLAAVERQHEAIEARAAKGFADDPHSPRRARSLIRTVGNAVKIFRVGRASALCISSPHSSHEHAN